jgi:hypothetical protein
MSMHELRIKVMIRRKLQRVLGQFPEYNMNILVRDFSAKLGTENILKLTNENENLHEINKDTGVKVINLQLQKI